jgi:hypothetical protein
MMRMDRLQVEKLNLLEDSNKLLREEHDQQRDRIAELTAKLTAAEHQLRPLEEEKDKCVLLGRCFCCVFFFPFLLLSSPFFRNALGSLWMARVQAGSAI